MRIIVNNQSEADLIKKFLDACHELGVADLMEQEDAEQNGTEQMLDADDYRILGEAVFFETPAIEVDPKESELRYHSDDFVTGTCVHCSTETMGTWMDDPLTYESLKDMNSEEYRKKWRCEDCQKKLCDRCRERTCTNLDVMECDQCLGEDGAI